MAQNKKVKSMTALNDATDSIRVNGKFNVIVGGTFVGTVVLQYKNPSDNNWVSDTVSITTPAGYSGEVNDLDIRLLCSAYTSGTIEASIAVNTRGN